MLQSLHTGNFIPSLPLTVSTFFRGKFNIIIIAKLAVTYVATKFSFLLRLGALFKVLILLASYTQRFHLRFFLQKKFVRTE